MRRKGEGSILERRRKNGTVAYLLKYEGAGVNGKRKIHYKTAAGSTLREAQRELRELLKSVDNRTHVDASKITVAEFVKTWVSSLEGEDLANKTKQRYRELLEQYALPRIGQIRLQELTPLRLKDWRTELATSGRAKPKTNDDGTVSRGLSPTTVRHAHRALHTCLEDAIEARLISANPAVIPSKEKRRGRKRGDSAGSKTRVRALGKEQLKVLLAGLHGGDLYLLASLLAFTGLRRGEALGLAWRHIDFDKAELTVERSVEQIGKTIAFKSPKTEESERTMRLPDELVAMLRAEWKRQAELQLQLGRRIGNDHVVFQPDPLEPARPWAPDWISRKFMAHARKLGFKIGLHTLRHTYASIRLAAGVPATAVAKRLGHASVRTTLSVYSHAVEEAERHLDDMGDDIARDVLGPGK